MSKYRWKIGVFAPTGSVCRKISGRNHSCQKTRMNDLSCGIKMWVQVSFILSQSTRLTDGDAHGTLTAIGVLLLPDHRSGIPCRPNCDNAILSDNSNGV